MINVIGIQASQCTAIGMSGMSAKSERRSQFLVELLVVAVAGLTIWLTTLFLKVPERVQEVVFIVIVCVEKES